MACVLVGALGLAACADRDAANTNVHNANGNTAVVANANTANANVANVNRADRDDDVDATTPDGWITAKTKLALMGTDNVSAFDVDVDTANAVVTLSGTVDTPEARAAAERAAKGVRGVKSVTNALQVVPDARADVVERQDEEIENALNNLLKGDTELAELNLSGKVEAGVVTLNGTVAETGTLYRAASAVRKLPGVKRVVTTAVKIDRDAPPAGNTNGNANANTNRGTMGPGTRM